jgi:hypothetical protein
MRPKSRRFSLKLVQLLGCGQNTRGHDDDWSKSRVSIRDGEQQAFEVPINETLTEMAPPSGSEKPRDRHDDDSQP